MMCGASYMGSLLCLILYTLVLGWLCLVNILLDRHIKS
jgi:hypothetical protein